MLQKLICSNFGCCMHGGTLDAADFLGTRETLGAGEGWLRNFAGELNLDAGQTLSTGTGDTSVDEEGKIWTVLCTVKSFGHCMEKLWTHAVDGGETLDAAWRNFGCCMEKLWTLHGETLDAAWRNFGRCMEKLWMLHGETLDACCGQCGH